MERSSFMKRSLYYVSWTLLISFVLYAGSKVHFYLKQQTEVTYDPIPQLLFVTFFPIIIGVLLRLPSMWSQRNSTKWGMDWPKLIAVGVPSLYVSIGMVLTFIFPIPELPLISFTTSVGYPIVHIVSGIVCGYVVVDSIRISKT